MIFILLTGQGFVTTNFYLLQWQSEYAMWLSRMQESQYSGKGSVGFYSGDLTMGGIKINALKVRINHLHHLCTIFYIYCHHIYIHNTLVNTYMDINASYKLILHS